MVAEQKQIELKWDLQTILVAGDAERLAQVVSNLVNNAITYNRENGEVWLRLVSDKHDAVLTVSDIGIGIDQRDLPRIFEWFYRADQARSGNVLTPVADRANTPPGSTIPCCNGR
jgi:signal transduction histidine kinase